MVATIVISILIAAACGRIVYNMIKNKKEGKTSCGCNGCSMSGTCHRSNCK